MGTIANICDRLYYKTAKSCLSRRGAIAFPYNKGAIALGKP
ncbi:hypothetical protein [Synechocystis sp. PCC 7509]|nr:hypothetical protein [Synechocystis sp. PCC 7509]